MINTNGFKSEYIKATEKLAALKKGQAELDRELEPIYEELRKFKERYHISEKESRKKTISTEIRDWKNFREYYYFRYFVDGIYNIFKKYGWKHIAEVFNFLEDNYNIQTFFEESFEFVYHECICDLTPTTTFSHRYIGIDEEYLVWDEWEPECSIKMSVDLDIEKVLTTTEIFLQGLIELNTKKEADEEYKTYLRLKEKFENK